MCECVTAAQLHAHKNTRLKCLLIRILIVRFILFTFILPAGLALFRFSLYLSIELIFGYCLNFI